MGSIGLLKEAFYIMSEIVKIEQEFTTVEGDTFSNCSKIIMGLFFNAVPKNHSSR